MNCQSFENNVTDLTRRQPREANALAEALDHSESCATCASQLKEQRSLTRGLRSLAVEMKTIEISGRVEDQLLVQLRQRTVMPMQTEVTPSRWLALAAIAAVLLMVVGAIALRRVSMAAPTSNEVVNLNPATETPSQPAPQSTITPRSLVASVVNSPLRPDIRPRRIAKFQRPKPATDSASTVAHNSTISSHLAEVTTEFMPLGDTSVANLQDGAQVVRVEMPRYAMARFGLPVNMERYDEKVKADVWVGIDGLARAIRFVQ